MSRLVDGLAWALETWESNHSLHIEELVYLIRCKLEDEEEAMEQTTVTKTVTFEAAHYLPKVPEGHKCARIHGHSYTVRISVKGPRRANGMVVDFADIKGWWESDCKPLLDHQVLNDIKGLKNPTAEHIARWIHGRLSIHTKKHLLFIRLKETATTEVMYPS